MKNRIARVWRGWTTPDKAADFERMLVDRILPEIQDSQLPGLRSITLMKRDEGVECEYQTILLFDSLDSIKAFAGEDAEKAHLDPEGVKQLSRYDERARHYELVLSIDM